MRILLLFGGLLLAACSSREDEGGAPTPAATPNVVVYLIDTLRADHLGCYGYERDTSPNLDALAREAVVFEQANAQASWTKPSVGSLFTGLLPARHGAVRRESRLAASVPTLAEQMKARGYSTAAFVSNPNVLPIFGFERGFDAFVDVDSVAKGGDAARVHAAVYEYLEERPSAPLFLYVHTRDPHFPYDPPPPFDTRFEAGKTAGDKKKRGPRRSRERIDEEIARYDGEIAFGDHEFGKFVERLAAEGLYEDTLLVVLSDHGEEFYDHGGISHGRTLFQEQLHVPLLVRLPQGARAARVAAPVRLVDLLPTVLELVGAAVPEGIDGASFLPLLTGTGGADYAPLLYAQLDHEEHLLSSLRQGDRKLIRRQLPSDQQGRALFDLDADPREENDLSQAESEAAAALAAALDRIESTLTAGTYLELTNASSAGARQRVRAEIEIVGGTLENLRMSGWEAEDSFELSDDRTRLTIDAELRNLENPIGQDPPFLLDVERVRFDPRPAEATLRVRITSADSSSVPLLLGSADEATGEVTELRASDARLSLPGAATTRATARNEAHGRLYSIRRADASSAEIDPELDERLRALGYTGTDGEEEDR